MAEEWACPSGTSTTWAGAADRLPGAPAGLGRDGPPLYRWKNDDRYGIDTSLTDYGGNIFARFTIVPSIFGQVEWDYTNYEYVLLAGGTDRSSTSDFLAGGGFFQPAGKHGGFYASILYNFSYDDNDPFRAYDSPWVYRIGATFGF